MPKDALKEADHLCAAFSHASALGFAIFDTQMRHEAINDALVAINGLPAAAHFGNTTRDLFGNPVADKIEPHVQRLVATGNPSVFEISTTLPTRSEPGSWILHYFAVHGIAGTVIGTGLVAVEVTEQRKLDGLVSQLTYDLLRKQTRDNWWLARELPSTNIILHWG